MRHLTRIAGIILWFALAAHAGAQMSGTYSCANGNPGAAFDYADIGDFFDDIENQGVGGPLVLEVYDNGGPFISKVSYCLGGHWVLQQPFIPIPVVGLSITNTLTIRAAAGENPVISGSDAPSSPVAVGGGRSGLSFEDIGYTTIEGLTLDGSSGSGIRFVRADSGKVLEHVRITRCRISNQGRIGINIYGTAGEIDNVTIENNMIWGTANQAVYSHRSGVEWVIRHNTVLKSIIGAAFEHNSGEAWSVFDNNIIQLTANGHVIKGFVPPVNADGNVMLLPSGSYVTSAHLTWAQWQTAGYDPNGLNADPLLMNLNPGQEDLRLQPGSPARDFLPVGSVQVDVFGNPRPMGSAYDAGAHEYPLPRVEVEYNSSPVANAGAVQVGDVLLFGETRAFTIRNTHAADLILTGTPPVILTPGANVATASVQSQPGLTTIPFNGSTTFTVYIEPAAAGPFDLQVSIANSDAANNPYVFTINGNGITNAAARADPAPGSNFTGPPGGPYVYAVNPGDPLANAEIVLSDFESDAITVTSIAQINPPTGVNTPTTPAPGHPITLAWTGTMDASNPAGLYEYQVSFHDAVNGTPVSVTLFITSNDLPPTHTIANASAGDGSAGNPYMAAFTEGDDSTNTLDLATLDDVNIGQSVTLAGFSPGTGNPPGGVGFAFTAAGTLTIAPAGTLLPADVGTHTYTVQITDGTNLVNVHVAIGVAALPPPPPPIVITTTSLPDGEVGASYAQMIQLTGGSGGFVFTVQAGNLPQGLLLNASTGEITGKPTTAGAETFTIHIIDQGNVTATQQYTLNIQPATAPPPTDNNPGGDGPGCSARHSAHWGALLLLLAALGGGQAIFVANRRQKKSQTP